MLGIYIGAGVGGFVVLIVIVTCIWVKSKKYKGNNQFEQVDLSRTTSVTSAATRKDTVAEPPQMNQQNPDLESPKGINMFDNNNKE